MKIGEDKQLRMMLEDTRETANILQEKEQDIFERLEDLYELQEQFLEDRQTNAENAGNLKEAICCYIQYGEFGIDALIEKLSKAEEAKIWQEYDRGRD